MQELLTKAWVLERIPVGEADELVTLYTQEFGKVRARAKSIRKITSRVSAHLQLLALTQVRFIRRNNYAVLDAMTENRPRIQLAPIARLVLDMTHEWETDQNLWAYIEEIHSQNISEREINKNILALLGFDSRHASCIFCDVHPVHAFLKSRHEFICAPCASKISGSEVVYIK